MGLPVVIGKESACQCRRRKKCGFDPWVRKIPWREGTVTHFSILAWESHGQRSLAGYGPQGCPGSERARYNQSDLAHTRSKKQTTTQRPKENSTIIFIINSNINNEIYHLLGTYYVSGLSGTLCLFYIHTLSNSQNKPVGYIRYLHLMEKKFSCSFLSQSSFTGSLGVSSAHLLRTDVSQAIVLLSSVYLR